MPEKVVPIIHKTVIVGKVPEKVPSIIHKTIIVGKVSLNS